MHSAGRKRDGCLSNLVRAVLRFEIPPNLNPEIDPFINVVMIVLLEPSETLESSLHSSSYKAFLPTS